MEGFESDLKNEGNQHKYSASGYQKKWVWT
jgi:hypothetical protein